MPNADAARPAADEPRLLPTLRSEPGAPRLGAQGSIQSGVAPDLAPGGGLFLELGARALPATARLTVHGVHQRSEVDRVRLAVSLLAARLDGCPWRWDAGALSLEPCLGVDVGVLQASSSGPRAHADRGTWAAALALLRSRLQLWPALAPELQLAAVLPVVGRRTSQRLLRIEALSALGRRLEATELATRFVAQHPDSPLSERAQRLLGARVTTAWRCWTRRSKPRTLAPLAAKQSRPRCTVSGSSPSRRPRYCCGRSADNVTRPRLRGALTATPASR